MTETVRPTVAGSVRVVVTFRKQSDNTRLDRVIAEARRDRAAREKGYREQALKIYPWVCGRCAREFTPATVRLLEVHHRDHNHDNNPADGSNWELLCTYCHENEHRRFLDAAAGGAQDSRMPAATYKAFAGLDGLLKKQDEK